MQDGALKSQELEELFSTAPSRWIIYYICGKNLLPEFCFLDYCFSDPHRNLPRLDIERTDYCGDVRSPWEESIYSDAAETNSVGGLTLHGFLSLV
jgi:hypothetical protein